MGQGDFPKTSVTKGQSHIIILLLTTIELSLGGSSPYTSTDETNKNKYT